MYVFFGGKGEINGWTKKKQEKKGTSSLWILGRKQVGQKGAQAQDELTGIVTQISQCGPGRWQTDFGFVQRFVEQEHGPLNDYGPIGGGVGGRSDGRQTGTERLHVALGLRGKEVRHGVGHQRLDLEVEGLDVEPLDKVRHAVDDIDIPQEEAEANEARKEEETEGEENGSQKLVALSNVCIQGTQCLCYVWIFVGGGGRRGPYAKFVRLHVWKQFDSSVFDTRY